MADGRVFIGRQAISAGLVDAIATQESLIADLAAGRIGRRANGHSGAVSQFGVGGTLKISS
jgi:ClpP class serine protease